MTVLVVVEAAELRRLITEAVAEALTRDTRVEEWVDARSSGLGRRTFLRLARAGAFPVSKVGKKYVARRTDVAAYLEGQRLGGPASGPEPERSSSNAPRLNSAKATADDPIARALAAGRLRVLKRSP